MPCKYTELSEMIKEHWDEGQALRAGIAHHGPSLIRKLLDRRDGMSLRALARESGFSPTYLSQALNNRVILSEWAYVNLAGLLREAVRA